MSSVFWSHQLKKSQERYDVIIIGGGFVGLSTAYWLKKKSPAIQIGVIEKENIGFGASGRNAGFLTKGSALFYSHLFKEWGESTTLELFNYAQDSIHLTVNELKLTDPKSSSYTFIRSKEVQDKINSLPDSILKNFKSVDTSFSKNFITTFASENEYSINPLKLLERLYKTNLEMGVDFIIGAQVEKIEHSQETLLYTSFGKLRSDKLVVCTNGFSHLLPELNLGIIPQRAQMLAYKVIDNSFHQGLFYDPEERVYFKFSEPGVLLVGGKRLVDEKNEQTSDTNTSFIIQDALMKYVEENLKLNGSKLTSWSGTMGFTPSEIPVVGVHSKFSNCYIAAGFSGHGMGWGFKTAEQLSNFIMDRGQIPQLAKIKK